MYTTALYPELLRIATCGDDESFIYIARHVDEKEYNDKWLLIDLIDYYNSLINIYINWKFCKRSVS